MGHNPISIVAKAVVVLAVVVYVVSIIAIVGDDKANEGQKEKRNPWYYIAAAIVCLLIGCLLPE